MFGFFGSQGVPPGTIAPFVGDVIPGGWLKLDGSLVLVADFPRLYKKWYPSGSAIDFQLPDWRGFTPRGDVGDILTNTAVTSYNGTTNEIVMTSAHNINRPGVQVKVAGGIPGVADGVYYAAPGSVPIGRTLKLYPTLADAVAGTNVVDITATASGAGQTVKQWVDPDYSSRVSQFASGYAPVMDPKEQADATGPHAHTYNVATNVWNGGSGKAAAGLADTASGSPFSTNSGGGNETRSKNVGCHWMVKT